MPQIVIGTAGHIDHGKTTLVKCLTGTDTDRLREEQERGMTIDLGFAFLNDEITIIDVPGHEKFIRNMVAGVSAIDAALLTIAADDGIMPQTQEHLDILSILGVPTGVVAITKTDLIDDSEWLDLLEEEIEEFLAGTFLDSASIFRVSGETGEGVEKLKDALLGLSASSKEKRDRGFFRMFADRAFSMKGFGTVATGTVTGGSLRVGEEVEILPSLAKSKVRGLQSHGHDVDGVELGDRAAMNLSHAEKGALKRGSQLAEIGFLKPSDSIGVSFTLLERTDREIKHQQRVRVHIGTEEILGRIYFVEEGRKRCVAGETAVALVRLEREAAAAVEDPFILRFYSPAESVGGGTVVDPRPPTLFKHTRPWLASLAGKTYSERLEKFFERAARKPMTLSEWSGRWQVSAARFREEISDLETVEFGNTGQSYITLLPLVEAQRDEYVTSVESLLKQRTYRRGVPQEDLRNSLGFSRPLFDWLTRGLEKESKVQIDGGTITLSGYTVSLSADDEALTERLVLVLKKSGFTPPALGDLAEEASANGTDVVPLLHILKDQGEACQISGKLWYHREVIDELRSSLRDRIGNGNEFSVTEFKDLTRTSRKHAIPLLEYLDSQRITDRVGDKRILLS